MAQIKAVWVHISSSRREDFISSRRTSNNLPWEEGNLDYLGVEVITEVGEEEEEVVEEEVGVLKTPGMTQINFAVITCCMAIVNMATNAISCIAAVC